MVIVMMPPLWQEAEIGVIDWHRCRLEEQCPMRRRFGKAGIDSVPLTETHALALVLGQIWILLAGHVSIGNARELSDARADDARWDLLVRHRMLVLVG